MIQTTDTNSPELAFKPDTRAEFRELLQEAWQAPEFDTIGERLVFRFRVSRIMRSPRLFDRLHSESMELFQSDQAFWQSQGTQATENNFLEMFLAWLADGGWEKILELILKLL